MTRDVYLKFWNRTVAYSDPVSLAVSAVDYIADLCLVEED